MSENKRILLAVATSKMVLSFRRDMIKKFQSEGYSVAVAALDGAYGEVIEKELGVKFYCMEDNNRSLSPLKILSLKNKYVKVIKDFKPDVVFTFMLKPNIFATLASKKAGIKKVFSMVEGAGDVFVNNGLKWRIIRAVVCAMYKRSFKIPQKIFFLNDDDREEFIRRKLVKREKSLVVHGIGVNVEHFAYKPVKNYNVFLMVARMTTTKGVFEFCECARQVKKLHPSVVFNYVGEEGTVKVADIQEYIDDGSVNYLGETNDVRPYYEDASVCILPSYREGFGLVNIECGAVGRAVITCNTNGTRDTVLDGRTGFLISVKDVATMVEKVCYFIENKQAIVSMGQNAKEFVESNFNQKRTNQKIFDIVEKD